MLVARRKATAGVVVFARLLSGDVAGRRRVRADLAEAFRQVALLLFFIRRLCAPYTLYMLSLRRTTR